MNWSDSLAPAADGTSRNKLSISVTAPITGHSSRVRVEAKYRLMKSPHMFLLVWDSPKLKLSALAPKHSGSWNYRS